MPLLSRKRLILTKIEGTYGTDSSPAGTDALLVRNLEVTPIEAETVSRDLIRPYLGNSAQILSQTRVVLTFEVELAGSGTSGTASKMDSLLRACGLAATTTASAVTGTAQAGSAGSITLASGASATDDYYNGMVISITGGTGNGSKGIITDYVGSTKVATVQKSTAAFTPATSSTYSIEANVGYKPVSSSFESATIYFNNDGVLHKATGCRGTFSLNLEVGQLPVVNFTMTGIYNAPTDTAAPSTTYTNQATPLIFKAGNTSAVSVLGYADACLQMVSLDVANEIVYRELVGCTKQVLITNRAPAGEVMIEAPTIAAKDYFTIANDDTTGILSLLHGTTAGNQVSLLAPIVDIGNPSYSDQDGIQMLTLPYVAIPSSSGNDELVLTFS
jgi:hypothetical protein